MISWNLKPNWAPALTINGTPGNSGTFFVRTTPTETITLPNNLTIDPFVSYGSVSPASVTFQWELLDGPAPVIFTTPNEPFSEIRFDLPGTYNLRLNATAFDFDQSQEIKVTVHDSYLAWVDRTFKKSTPGETEKENDPDNDGISNLFEFILGLDPSTQDNENFPTPIFDAGSKTLNLTWTNRQLDPKRFSVIAEVSDDLKNWRSDSASIHVETLSSSDLTESFRAVALVTADQNRTHFMRLRAICFDKNASEIAPEIISLTNLANAPNINFTSQLGKSYQLEAFSDPSIGWIPVGESIVATSKVSVLVDRSPNNERNRFYRVRVYSGD